MKYRRWIIGLLTLVLMALALLGYTRESHSSQPEIRMNITVQTDAGTERAALWQNPEGGYAVFLPGYADMEQVLLSCKNAWIDGIAVSGETSCSRWSADTAYPFLILAEGQELESTITFVRSGGLPTLYVDTQSGTMDYIHLDKTNRESGALRLYGAGGELLCSETVTAIKGRGNTSWGAEKKPYNLTLAREADLLGMGKSQRWILLAEGHNALNIRNKIVYDFADQTGLVPAPDCEWVDLYLNGEYAGLYLLCERIEIGTDRLNIPRSGSFIVSLEVQKNLENQGIPYLLMASNQALRIRETDVQEQTMTRMLQSVENAILAEDGIDPVSGKSWQELIDLDSWAAKYVLEEVFANPDGGAVSQYFYYNGSDPAGRIFAGPVWDYDYALGGEGHWIRSYPAFLTMVREYTDDGIYIPWFPELYRKAEFRQRVESLFAETVLPALQTLAEESLDRYGEEIRCAGNADRIRWNNPENTVEQELRFLKAFLNRRIEFLTDRWCAGTEYHIVRVQPGSMASGFLAVKDGECLPELPDAQALGGIGWFYADTDEAVDFSAPIRSDIQIYVKKPENRLPLLHFGPVCGLICLLPVLLILDRKRTGANGR